MFAHPGDVPKPQLPEEPELIRRGTVYVLVCGFLTGFGLCFIIDHDDNHHGPGAPLTVSHTAEACGTPAVLCKDHLDCTKVLLASSLETPDNTLYEGVSLRPPFPPPRG